MFDSGTGRLTLGDISNTLSLVGKSEKTSREIEATVRTPHLSATHAFHELTGIADFESLGRLLSSFAEDWRGWEGERQWQSADNDFSLVCTHDGVRGVRVAVCLSDYLEGWKLEGIVVLLEAGRLEEVAGAVREFMASLRSETHDR